MRQRPRIATGEEANMEQSDASGKRLVDFNPLENVELPGNKTISNSGLVLIVGPNSSGKTQFLKDVHASMVGQPRQLVVAKAVNIKKPNSLASFLQTLEAEGCIQQHLSDKGVEVLKVRTVPLGGYTPGLQKEYELKTVTSWFANLQDGQVNQNSLSFHALFGAMLTTALFLGNRLTAANRTGSYDYETAPPTNDLQALYGDSRACDELTQAVSETFGRAIWVDPTRGGVLCFRVTESPDLPCADDRLKPDRVTKYRVLDEEGDGLRSFVAICMALALSRRPICLIDEPETCLHPPQAYALGKIIGRQAARRSSTTLVATHSSHVLRGVIQQTSDLQIVRLTKVGGKFQAHLVDSGLLRSATEKPLVRTEAIFDGLFADGVILVESDGDRAVYQAAWESLASKIQLDLLFVPVNGKGAMASIAHFFGTLRIPVAIVADLDLIRDDGSIPKLLIAMSVDESTIEEIRQKCRDVVEAIKLVPPTITPIEVENELLRIQELPRDWHVNNDEALMRELRSLGNRLDRMRRLKPGGISAYRSEHPGIASQLEALRVQFWLAGVFVVPVGELEAWLSEAFMKGGPSKERKQEWADEAATRIRQRPGDAGPITDFIKQVAAFLAERETISG